MYTPHGKNYHPTVFAGMKLVVKKGGGRGGIISEKYGIEDETSLHRREMAEEFIIKTTGEI